MSASRVQAPPPLKRFQISELSDVTKPDGALSARWRRINPRTYVPVEPEPAVRRRRL